MAALIERRSSASAFWARRISSFAFVLLLISSLSHRFGLVGTIPFFWLLTLVAGLAILSLLLATVGFARLWQRGDRGGRASLRATLVAVFVLLPFGFAAFRAATLPPLVDISTDTANPPSLAKARLARTTEMNPIGSAGEEAERMQAEAYPLVTGHRYPLPLERMEESVDAVLDDLGWSRSGSIEALADSEEVTIEAVAKSPVLGLVSDVAIRIVDEGESTYVDVRSASRYGPHDLGDNAAKILRFYAALDADIEARNAPIQP